MPRYDYGSFYSELISVNGFLSDLKVAIWQPGDVTLDDELIYTDFDVNAVKFFVSGLSNTVFLRKISTGLYQLEYGSGTHGVWLPEASSQKTIETTEGAGGNIPKQTTVALKGSITIKDYEEISSGQLELASTPLSLSANQYVSAFFQYSEGGSDALTSDALRQDIIEFIQSRDNLVSELDYYNIVSKYQPEDVKFLFKKTQVYDNIFYMLKVFRDRFQDVARTTNHTILELEVDKISPERPLITSVTTTTGGDLAAGTYTYYIQAVNEFFETRWSLQSGTTVIGSPSDAVVIEWEAVPGAQYYRVYGRIEDSQDRFWTVPSTQLSFTDLGTESDEADNIEDVFPPPPTVTFSASPGTVPAGTYGYRVGYQDDSGQWIISPETQITTVLIGAIEVTWDEMPFADKYYIWGRTPGNSEQYWTQDDVSLRLFLDDTAGTPGISGSLPDVNFRYTYVLYPEFTISDIEFISPFLYRWNSFFTWYDGFLFNSQLFVNFQDVTIRQEPNAFDPPSLYLYITYDENLRKSNVDVKSYQAIGPAVVIGTSFTDTTTSPETNYPPYQLLGSTGSPLTPQSSTLIFKFNNDLSWTTVIFEDPDSPLSSPGTSILTVQEIADQINDAYGQDVAFVTDDEQHVKLMSPAGITPGQVYIHSSSTYAQYLGLPTDDTNPISEEDTLNYEFNIFSVGSSVLPDSPMYAVDTNTFRYDFDYDFGFIPENAQFEVKLYMNRNNPDFSGFSFTNDPNAIVPSFIPWPTGSGIIDEIYKEAHYATPAIKQIININDQLILPRYVFAQSENYILNIPVIELSTYNDDVQYYNEAIKDFMATTQFEENRMITDIIQTRFLNTIILEPPYLSTTTVQRYTILSQYNHLTPVNSIESSAPNQSSQGDRHLILESNGSPSDDFYGKDNQIATWDSQTGWSFYIPENDDSVFVDDINDVYRFDETLSPDQWINDLNVVLPLNMRITIRMNDTYVADNQVNLVSERRSIIVQVADALQKKYTGSNITYYNSQIADLVHSDRIWVDEVRVNVTDSLGRQINNGIETKIDQAILEELLPDKLSIAKYTPLFFYWDVNALEIILIS